MAHTARAQIVFERIKSKGVVVLDTARAVQTAKPLPDNFKARYHLRAEPM